MSIKLNPEYIYKASQCTSQDIMRDVLKCIYIYDLDGMRFYAGTDSRTVIELGEKINGDKLSVDNLLLFRPKQSELNSIRKSDFLELLPPDSKQNIHKYLQETRNLDQVDANLSGKKNTINVKLVNKSNFPDVNRIFPDYTPHPDQEKRHLLCQESQNFIVKKLAIQMEDLVLHGIDKYQVRVKLYTDTMRFMHYGLTQEYVNSM